jgi:hypothetical protein
MADQNRQTDCVEIPEVGALRHLDKNPTEEESVERDQDEGMGKVPMIFEIELAVEKAKNEIGVREESHTKTCNRSPMTNSLIIDGSGNDRPCEGVSNGVHNFIVTGG